MTQHHPWTLINGSQELSNLHHQRITIIRITIETRAQTIANTLEYAFLEQESTLPVIISSSLNDEQKGKLLDVLKEHKGALGWTIADIKV